MYIHALVVNTASQFALTCPCRYFKRNNIIRRIRLFDRILKEMGKKDINIDEKKRKEKENKKLIYHLSIEKYCKRLPDVGVLLHMLDRDELLG